jgi:hypothetical protein
MKEMRVINVSAHITVSVSLAVLVDFGVEGGGEGKG